MVESASQQAADQVSATFYRPSNGSESPGRHTWTSSQSFRALNGTLDTYMDILSQESEKDNRNLAKRSLTPLLFSKC